MEQPQEVILIQNGLVAKWEPLTIAWNDLDGVGYGVFLIRLKDLSFRIAQFEWGVRPGAKPKLTKLGVSVGKHGGAAAIPLTDLSYDVTSLKGSIQHGKSVDPQTIEVAMSQIKVFSWREAKALKVLLSRYGFSLTE